MILSSYLIFDAYQHAYNAVVKMFNRLELQLHPEKTKKINLWGGKEGFDFLGFHNRNTIRKSKRNTML